MYVIAGIGWVLLWVLVGLLGLILLIVLALLLLPLDLSARLEPDLACTDWEDDWSGTVPWSATLRFGGALLRLILTGQGLSRPAVQVWLLGHRLRSRAESHRARKAKRAPKQAARKKPDWELRWALVEEGWKFVVRLWQELGWQLHGEVTYGLPDPALTGLCEALRWSCGLPTPLRLYPTFVQPRLAGWAEAQGRIFGWQIAMAAWAACKHPVIRDRIKRRLRLTRRA